MNQTLKAALLISLSSHFLFFGIFEPTFGGKVHMLGADKVAFLGSFLQTRDFSKRAPHIAITSRRTVNLKTVYPAQQEDDFLASSMVEACKPTVSFDMTQEKITYVPQKSAHFVFTPKEKPPLTFYPPLPYSFLFYFKDRQVAHMEFTFYISDAGKITLIKRKVSSGNLDTDLLAHRYITHCLFLQEGRFPRKTWQTVKIDLARKEND